MITIVQPRYHELEYIEIIIWFVHKYCLQYSPDNLNANYSFLSTSIRVLTLTFLLLFTAYRLRCSMTRFYKLWGSCYGQTHSRSACFGRLYKKHLFVAYSSGNCDKFITYILFFTMLITSKNKWIDILFQVD